MKWFFSLLLIFLLTIVFTNIKIRLEYIRDKKDDVVILEGSVWFGIIRVKYKIPVLKLQSVLHGVQVKKQATTGHEDARMQKKRFHITPREVSHYMNKISLLRQRVHDFNKIIKMTLSQFHCDQFEWRTRVGVGDAAVTGIITGLVWGVKSSILTIFTQYIRLSADPKINVVPAFQSTSIDTHFRCVLRFRIGHALIAGIRLIFNLRRMRGKRQHSLRA
jgi:hypothetical protein